MNESPRHRINLENTGCALVNERDRIRATDVDTCYRKV